MVAYETILTLFSVLNIAAANISQRQSSTRQVFPAEMQDSYRQATFGYRGNFSSRSPWNEPT
jgi:hypothetical protein